MADGKCDIERLACGIIKMDEFFYAKDKWGVGMAMQEKEIDITRNIKLIEWLKSELLTDLASLFRVLARGVREEMHEGVSDILSNIILITYLLGKRLGVSYNAVELKIQGKVKLGLVENNDVEKYYGDLSELSRHLGSYRRKEQ